MSTSTKLSAAQARAHGKLTREWKSAYWLQESLATLNALVDKGMAECKRQFGASWCPRTRYEYRRKA